MNPDIILKPKDFLTGMSSSPYVNDGLFSAMSGIDIFRNKNSYGLLQQGMALTDKTGSVIKDTIKWFIKRGSKYFGFGDDGYLYEIDGTTYVPIVLDSGNEGDRGGSDGGGRGLLNYEGKLHYFYKTGIGIFDFGSSFNDLAYTTNITDNPHPALEWQGIAYFGNGRYVGTLDGTTLNAQAFPIPEGYEIQDLEIHNNYLVILAIENGSTNGVNSKIFLWDTISTNGWNYEYPLPEKCYALEKAKNNFVVFGANVRLFNGGDFTVIDELQYNYVTTPGATCYKNNTVYYKDTADGNSYELRSYGSPISGIKPTIHSPLRSILRCGAIFPLSSEENSFLISGEDKLYVYFEDYSGGSLKTNHILFNHNKIKKIAFHFENLAENDGIKISLKKNSGVIKNDTITYAANGAIEYKEIIYNSVPLISAYLELTWIDYSSGNLKIKQIDIYVQQTEIKT